MSKMGSLQGKVAVVTGANSGIGKRTAELFVDEGASVVLVARRLEKLQEVEAGIRANGGIAISVAADVSKEEDCKNAIQKAIDTFGRIDILVNNAGMADKHRPITRIETDWWDQVIGVNQNSIFYMCKEALKYMEPAKSGSIVNISSIGGVFGSAGISYSASKSAVLGMTKNIAIQFAGKGIRCNAVCPGPTPTPLTAPEAVATFDTEFAEQCGLHMNTNVPEATVDDQAQTILFFASDASKAVTGQTIIVDNGCTL